LIILVVDRFSPHVSVEVAKAALKRYIILWYLPVRTTAFLMLQDAFIYGSIKRDFRKNYTKLRGTPLSAMPAADKYLILQHALFIAEDRCLTKASIKKSFRVTGLCPFDKGTILARAEHYTSTPAVTLGLKAPGDDFFSPLTAADARVYALAKHATEATLAEHTPAVPVGRVTRGPGTFDSIGVVKNAQKRKRDVEKKAEEKKEQKAKKARAREEKKEEVRVRAKQREADEQQRQEEREQCEQARIKRKIARDEKRRMAEQLREKKAAARRAREAVEAFKRARKMCRFEGCARRWEGGVKSTWCDVDKLSDDGCWYGICDRHDGAKELVEQHEKECKKIKRAK